jgi:tetratricopeptide (TPR) repeat protein
MKLYKCKAESSDYSDSYCIDINGKIIEKKSKPIDPKNNKNTPDKAPLYFAPGDAFGKRYLIMEEISQEDFSRIYRAIDKEQKKIVTLRIFSPELSENGWLKITQKLKEKKKTGKSSFSKEEEQDNITKLYDLGKVGNTKFISTQYLDDKNPYKLSKHYKKLILYFSISIALLIGLVIFLALTNMKSMNSAAIGTAKKSIAVMYFKNNTGEESLEHWREALSDLLITDLAQSKYLRVLSEKKLFYILKQLDQLDSKEYSLEVLHEVAKKGKVEYILLGSFNKAGNQYRIDIKIQEAKTGELIGSETAQGTGEESIFTSVDELTKRIKNNFEFSEELMANDVDRNVGKITTSSPEAYKLYKEGEKYLREGNYPQSIQSYEKAVALDPECAVAYAGIAHVYYNMGNEAEYKKFIKKALTYADRIADKNRYKIQAAHAFFQSEKNWNEAIEAYTKLLQLYPDDNTANNNLGALYVCLERWDEAIERLEVLKKNNYEGSHPYTNLAYIYMRKGLYNKAHEILDYYLTAFPDNTEIHRYKSYTYLCQRQYDVALVEANKALTLDANNYKNHWLIGDIYHLQGDLNNAEKEYQKLIKSENKIAHLKAIYRLGSLYILQGNFEKAKDQFIKGIKEAEKSGQMRWIIEFHWDLAYLYLHYNKAEKALEEFNKVWHLAVENNNVDFQKWILYFKGISYLELNLLNEAIKTAEELKALIEQGMQKKHIRYYYHLMGVIELKRNHFPIAIENFKKALSLLPHQRYPDSWHALFIDHLASAYYQAAKFEKACKEYEKITALTTGRIIWGDVYAKSYYKLGKIYQQKDWKGKAIDNYQTFLDLWKDADPNIPEIVDAKKQLALLQST